MPGRTRLDRPRHGDTSGIEAGKIAEHSTRHVDGLGITTHALVDNSTGGSLAVVANCDLGTAESLSHDGLGKGDDVLSGTVVGGVAVAGSRHGGGSVVVSTGTRTRLARSARAAAAAARRGRGRGRGSCGGG